ncbi:Arabidopsis protein of unknown function (DUF241 [Striga hermonthica]|uniref:Uncharacterized protein n=1 Tax=Striga hermonthica TaxID=68872 RepID=A0A9N7MT83_STRHE|nr:Arabidopsis protein of unknown function (DUF241 [Striga hermonthica]
MASFHARSNSFPSQSHPIVNDVKDHLERLKAASQATSTSSICANLASLANLHDSINIMIQMPSVQQALACEQGETWINELLDGSLRLVDICGVSRDILQLTKESVQDLASSIRRQADDVSIYVASRKKVNKMVNKCIKNLKTSNQNSTPFPAAIGMMVKETESLDSAILRSVLVLLSGEREKSSKKSWSTLLSKFTQSTGRVHDEAEQESRDENLCSLDIQKALKNMDSKATLKQLKASEMSIQELEECLEALFRSLVKTRVSLLNALSH